MSKWSFALAGLLALSSLANAGPFRFFRPGNYFPNNTNNNQGHNGLWTCQDAANFQASIQRMGHFGNPTGGYEGVGMAGTADAAIRNCCFYGRRPLRDSGVAQAANGMWYACCRYN